MKNLFISLLACFLLLPVVAQETFTIYWNSNHYYDVYDEVFQQFAQDNNLELNIQNLLWPDMRTKLLADFTAGTVPDFLEVPAPWIAEFGAQGLMLDVTDWVNAWEESSDWIEATWGETTVDSSIYGTKLHHTALGLFYNRDLFEQAGLDPDSPPTTLAEFEVAVTTIANATDAFGYGFDPDDQYLLGFLASAETTRLTDGENIAIDTPTIRTTLASLQAIAASGNALIPEPGAAWQSTRRAFIDGQVAMILTGPWDVGNINNNNPDLNYSVAMVPVLEGVEARTLAAGTAVGIPADAKHAELAWELQKRITAVDIEVAATLEAGMLMPRKSWLTDERLADNRTVSDFANLLLAAEPFDIDVRGRGVNAVTWGGDIFSQLYQHLIYNTLPSDEALEQYIQEANRALSRAR